MSEKAFQACWLWECGNRKVEECDCFLREDSSVRTKLMVRYRSLGTHPAGCQLSWMATGWSGPGPGRGPALAGLPNRSGECERESRSARVR